MTKRKLLSLFFIFCTIFLAAGCGSSDNFNWNIAEINRFITSKYKLFANNNDFKDQMFISSNNYEYSALDNTSDYSNKFCNKSNQFDLEKIIYLGKYTNTGDKSGDDYFKVFVVYKNEQVGGDVLVISYIDQQTGLIPLDKTFIYDFSDFFHFPNTKQNPPITNFKLINKFFSDGVAKSMINKIYPNADLETFKGDNIKFYNFINSDFQYQDTNSQESNNHILIKHMWINLVFSVNFKYDGGNFTAQFITRCLINNGDVSFTIDPNSKNKDLLISKINILTR